MLTGAKIDVINEGWGYVGRMVVAVHEVVGLLVRRGLAGWG